MGEPQTWLRKIGLTRGKAALIAILAVALVGVLYIQYWPSDEGEAFPVPTPRQPRQAPRTAAQQSAAKTGDDETANASEPQLAAAFDQTRWKSPELTTVVAYDPFALPDSFPRPPQAGIDGLTVEGGVAGSLANSDAAQLTEAIEQLRMELEALQQRGVHVIVRGRDQYVAMIGDRTVHVGDEINGFTVTAIESDGVRVERKVNQ